MFCLMSRQSAKYRLPDFIREAGSARMREKLRVLFLISDRETSLNRDDVAGLLK
jgi:hypothetical protein